MKVPGAQIRQYFQPVFGLRPLRVRPGVGSFLTFEFGRRNRNYGHLYAQWRLWIYLSNWILFHGDHRLLDSDAERKRIEVIANRLEEETLLTDVEFDARRRKTAFSFGDFRLVVSPADYLDNISDRDAYWMFFMPDHEVLSARPSGLQLVREDACPPVKTTRKQDADSHTSGRLVRLQD
ncbi:MAG: hypothetical protein ABSH02_06690 [Candidatus Sulfotelmatobacter sp.]|jgi:hypothetical protein